MTNRELEFILKARDNASVSIEQFKARYETIAKDIQKVPVGSQQFEKLAKELNAAGNEMKVVQSYMKQVGDSSSNFNKLDDGMSKVNKSSGSAKMTLMSFSQVIQDAPYGIRGVANNIDFLTQNFTNLVASSGGAKNALSAVLASFTGPMGIMFAVSATTSLLTVFGDKLFNSAEAAGQSKEKISELNTEISDLENRLKIISDATYLQRLKADADDAKKKYLELTTVFIETSSSLETVTRKGLSTHEAGLRLVKKTTFETKGTVEEITEAYKKYLEAVEKFNNAQKDIVEKTPAVIGSMRALKQEETKLQEDLEKLVVGSDAWNKKLSEVATVQLKLKDATHQLDYALSKLAIAPAGVQPDFRKWLVRPLDAALTEATERFDRLKQLGHTLIFSTGTPVSLLPESTFTEIQEKIKRIQLEFSTAKIGTPDFEKWYSELNRLQKETEDALSTPIQKAQREWQKYQGVIRQGINILSQLSSQNSQAELDRIEAKKERELARYDEELARENLTDAQKKRLLADRAKVEEKYREEERKAKRKAWEADKTAKVLGAIMDTASAVVEALPNIPLSIIVGALGAAQTAIIASQPTPRFHQGSGGPVYYDAPPSQEFPIRVRGGETFEVKTEAQQRANREGGTSVININIYGAIADKQAFKRIVEDGMREMGVTDVNKYFVNQSGKVVFS